MNRPSSPSSVSSDDVLMREIMRVSTLLGRYLMTLLDANRPESPVDQEVALADRVASVARSMRARAAGRWAAASRSGNNDEEPGPTRTGSPGATGHVLEPLESAYVVARWPFLAPIVELPGPAWRFRLMPGGTLTCTRAHDAYAESLSVIEEDHIGLNRTPIRSQSGPVASTVDFAGSPAEVLAVLQQPVRWEDES